MDKVQFDAICIGSLRWHRVHVDEVDYDRTTLSSPIGSSMYSDPNFQICLSSGSILGIIQFFFKNYKARINTSSAGILPRSCFTLFNQYMLVSSDSTRSERN
jgi:hypothetical protein